MQKMRDLGCGLVHCREVEGSVAVMVLHADHPIFITAASWSVGVGGGDGGGGSFIVGRLFEDMGNANGVLPEMS